MDPDCVLPMTPTCAGTYRTPTPFGVAHYEDGNGKEHGVGLGVAHLYLLDPDGQRLYFNDWWLPADFSRQLCGPRRGTLPAPFEEKGWSSRYFTEMRRADPGEDRD